jgi:hypothetical protein
MAALNCSRDDVSKRNNNVPHDDSIETLTTGQSSGNKYLPFLSLMILLCGLIFPLTS